MSGINIGIVGATGLVGEELISIINNSFIEIKECRLFASEHSEGIKKNIRGTQSTVNKLDTNSANGLDYIFFCADNNVSKNFIPLFSRQGVICIDNSSAYRLSPEVPLVIPEINSQDLKKNCGIIANPNCSTIIALMALYPLHRLFQLNGFCVSTYQAVSGVGKNGILALHEDLEKDNHELSNKIFEKQIAYNAVPKIGNIDELGYSTEENKMCYESRKILNIEDLKVSAMCVRIPVLRAHSMAIFASFEKTFDLKLAKEVLSNVDYLDFYDGVDFPCAVEYSKCDKCGVGRLRNDAFLSNGASLWVCGDQIRKGAAMNAFQIMTTLESFKN